VNLLKGGGVAWVGVAATWVGVGVTWVGVGVTWVEVGVTWVGVGVFPLFKAAFYATIFLIPSEKLAHC